VELEEKSGFVLGAGAGPFHVLGMNSELMHDLSYRGEEVTNLTHYAKIDKQRWLRPREDLLRRLWLDGQPFWK
jgi:hypothetical protein